MACQEGIATPVASSTYQTSPLLLETVLFAALFRLHSVTSATTSAGAQLTLHIASSYSSPLLIVCCRLFWSLPGIACTALLNKVSSFSSHLVRCLAISLVEDEAAVRVQRLLLLIFHRDIDTIAPSFYVTTSARLRAFFPRAWSLAILSFLLASSLFLLHFTSFSPNTLQWPHSL